MKQPLRFGLIGHKFMGKAHSQALHDVPFFFETRFQPVRAVLCGLEDDLPEAAARYGWQRWTHSWREVVADPEIDVVVIATPGNTHCEIAIAAAEAGRHVICEKPLALDAEQAARMCQAVERAGVKHLVNFNYRRVPAVQLARQLIEQGRLGEIYYFRGTYWQDWPLDPAFPFVWRFDRAIAGAGSMADKGSHLVDLALFLVGDIVEVAATTEIFVRERPAPDGIARTVTTDDAAAFLARFRNGALGLFGTSRMSAGHKNALGFEVNGSRGSLIFDLERLNELQVYFVDDDCAARGFRTIMVTEPVHRYLERWWPPGHVLGWEHAFIHQYYEFLHALETEALPSPNFHDGLKVQRVLDAVEQAAAERRWIGVPEGT
jgi:predicted dehydrogenase